MVSVSRLILSASVAVSLACQPAESPRAGGNDAYAEQVRALCHAERTSEAISAFPYGAKGEALEGWLGENLTDPRARELYYETVMQSPVHHQGQVLEQAATDVGITPCPLAGYLEFLAKMPVEALSNEDCVQACLARNATATSEVNLDEACRLGCGG